MKITSFNSMSIKRRMLLSYALVITLFIAFGIISIRQMNSLNNLTITLYTHPLQVSNASLKAKAGVISMHRSMKDVSSGDTKFAVSLAIDKIQNEERNVFKELSVIKQYILGKEGQQIVEEATELFAGWKPNRVEVEELVLQGKIFAANKITRQKGADYVAELERKMEELTEYARHKADGFMADANQTQSRIRRNILVFIFVLIVLTVGIGYLMSSSILSSIFSLESTMSRIAKSGQLEKAKLTGHDEISKMSQHFNSLIQRLDDQFWLQKNDQDLNQLVSGNLDVEVILQMSIDHICRKINACAGAIYSVNTENKELELISSFALPKGKLFASSFPIGHGIVGQVATDKKAVLLENIEETDMTFESGTVKAPPVTLFVLPMIHENEVLGVFEIASFKPFGGVVKQYLESAIQIMTTAFHSSTQNMRIKSLFIASEGSNEKLQRQTAELKAQTNELQALNVEFRQQSNELQNQNEELEHQRQHVEEANKLKSEFLSNMSHELRTPLNSVNSLSKVLLLKAKEKLSVEELNYLEIIEKNGKHLLSLINDILDLSKIEAGRMDIKLSSFSLNTLIHNIVESVAPLALEKELQFQNKVPEQMLFIESDESRVYQILQNIIANAVKFTDQGSIAITAEQSADLYEITIKDTGIGIPADDLHNIFEEFRQVDGATSRRYEGTGLGLAIAYKAAKMLGGDITVHSVFGQGTEFTILLPVKHQGPKKEGIIFNKQITAVEGLVEQSVTTDTILIVDDDPAILDILSQAFHAEGYSTLLARSGPEAIELARVHKPHAITLDVIMPDMDGWEVLTKLKHDPETASIPVIIISVSEDRDTGFALGAVGYVTKPINKKVLINEIKQIYGHLPAKVLIVDDSDFDRNNARQIITQEGMQALLASSGKHCLELLEVTTPDVIVLDLMMAGMDGFEVLERIRENPKTANIPIIVVTAKDVTHEEKLKLVENTSKILAKDENISKTLLRDIKAILQKIGKKGLGGSPLTVEQKNRILLVEDNEVAVIQVKNALEKIGISVDVASDGQEALDYLQHCIPHGIILDLMMPNIDGFQTLDTLRSTDVTRELPVLIMTAKDLTKKELSRLAANNVFQLIQKGDVDKSDLLDKVKQMLQKVPSQKKGVQAALSLEKPAPELPKQRFQSLNERRTSVILIVEDNMDNMVTIKAILPKDLQIEEAFDGREGLNKAVEVLPDLILLDMALPKMDGIEVVKALKGRSDTKHIPVIALTAQAMKGDKERILKAGCDDYAAKPINPRMIKEKVDYWLSHFAKER